MASLPNSRHERFAQELADGKGATEAYRISGLERRLCANPEGFYVYMLCDPRDHSVFYVGKGKRQRWRQHEIDCRRGNVLNGAKHKIIQDILACGKKPIALLIEDCLAERAAFALERGMIVRIGRARLSNYAVGNPWAVIARRTMNMIRRVKPFGIWVAARKRTQEEIDLYWFVVCGLLKNYDNLTGLGHART